ncbi:MAG TPA: hypothetical protein ENJ35_01200 [Gammaproteobacteria bacterium]|nr:hypothetical protein [Gammaproteobacteria bacterium]
MLANLVTPQPIERTVRDIDNDTVIASALAAQVDVIATGDRDLLVLHPWQNIQILDAAEALQQVQCQIKPDTVAPYVFTLTPNLLKRLRGLFGADHS